MKCTLKVCSRYIPVVGRAFLVEQLYGSKYSPHLGGYQMPFLYVKTLLFCATGQGLSPQESRYVHGLIEALLPCSASVDNLTKLELLQLVDAVPVTSEGSLYRDIMNPTHGGGGGSGSNNNSNSGRGSSSSNSVEAMQHSNFQSRLRERAEQEGVLLDAEEEEGDSGAQGGGSSRRRARGREEADEDEAAGSDHHGDDGAPLAATFISPTSFPATMARVLLYDAVSACLADGRYTTSEKERAAMVATRVGLSSAVREQIERLALQEKVLSHRKARLLHGRRHHQHVQQQKQAADSHAAQGSEGGSEEDVRVALASTYAQGNNYSPTTTTTSNNNNNNNNNNVDSSGWGASLYRIESDEDRHAIEAAQKLLRRVRSKQKSQQLQHGL